MNTIEKEERHVTRTVALTLDIADTGLRWTRRYVNGTGRGSGAGRKITHSECWTDNGVYMLHLPRPRWYTVSFTPGVAGELGETIDLGQYNARTQCDERVAEHIRTGR